MAPILASWRWNKKQKALNILNQKTKWTKLIWNLLNVTFSPFSLKALSFWAESFIGSLYSWSVGPIRLKTNGFVWGWIFLRKVKFLLLTLYFFRYKLKIKLYTTQFYWPPTFSTAQLKHDFIQYFYNVDSNKRKC